MPCQRSFDPVGATGGVARAYCELESGSFRTPAGHGPAPQALQASIPGKLYDIAHECVRYGLLLGICGCCDARQLVGLGPNGFRIVDG
jgi:hypothetical protein